MDSTPISAWRPWNSPYAVPYERPRDSISQMQIEKCLRCPYATCWNCIENKNPKKGRPPAVSDSALLEALLDGHSVQEISVRYSVTVQTVRRRIRKLNNQKKE